MPIYLRGRGLFDYLNGDSLVPDITQRSGMAYKIYGCGYRKHIFISLYCSRAMGSRQKGLF